MKNMKSIKIKGQRYKIKHVQLIENEGLYGKCDFKNRFILIDENLKDDDFKSTFIHEIGHALLFEIGMCQAIHMDLHEIIVENYANELLKHFKIVPK